MHLTDPLTLSVMTEHDVLEDWELGLLFVMLVFLLLELNSENVNLLFLGM